MFQKILKRLHELTRRNVLLLLVIVFASASILIFINYFTIKTLSAVRAYTHGESQYSKGQKDAARYLILYVNTGDEFFWKSFQKEMAVPIGDSIARVTITNHGDDDLIRKGFLAGRNHPDDIANLVWLFRNFGEISFMKEAVTIWKNADVLVGQEYRLGLALHSKMIREELSPGEKASVIGRISELTTELTRLEWAFEAVLGSTGRLISKALFIVDVIMTIIILGSSGAYAIVMVRRLRKKNRDLTATNQELDRFVYSASHDLRAPITSLKGLIEIMKLEDDPGQITNYLQMMELSLNKQDQFIRDIIDFSRNKRTDIEITQVSLKKLIDEIIVQHRYGEQAQDMQFVTDLQTDIILSDPQRLSIIVGNLLSNAIKYSDPKKEIRVIKIKTHTRQQQVVLEIEDNGIGIRKEYLEKVFGMFFVTEHSSKGSGLGLYITRETVEKLGGTIRAESEIGKGSTLIVKLPMTNGDNRQISDHRR